MNKIHKKVLILKQRCEGKNQNDDEFLKINEINDSEQMRKKNQKNKLIKIKKIMEGEKTLKLRRVELKHGDKKFYNPPPPLKHFDHQF